MTRLLREGLDDTVGQVIWERQLELKLEAWEVAAQAGISPQYLSDIKGGRRDPPPDTLAKLARVLDLNLSFLLWLSFRHQVGSQAARDVRIWLSTSDWMTQEEATGDAQSSRPLPPPPRSLTEPDAVPWNVGPPTEPGLYWYVLTAGPGGEPVSTTIRSARVWKHPSGLLVATAESLAKPVDQFARRWAGPLHEPTKVTVPPRERT